MQRRSFLLTLLTSAAAAVTLPASAFNRSFPELAKRGRMTPGPFPQVVIDGRSRQLTPGARIWNEQNLTETPASIRGSDLVVNYTETDQGEIDRVWILTPEESSRRLGE